MNSPSHTQTDGSISQAEPEIDPSELENISWEIPDATGSATDMEGKSLECRFLGSHKSALSDGEPICDLIQKVRTQYKARIRFCFARNFFYKI